MLSVKRTRRSALGAFGTVFGAILGAILGTILGATLGATFGAAFGVLGAFERDPLFSATRRFLSLRSWSP